MYEDILSNMGLDCKYGSDKNLKNILMQLRKLCNHPYLFNGIEDESLPELGEHMITNSGKLLFLDQLMKKVIE